MRTTTRRHRIGLILAGTALMGGLGCGNDVTGPEENGGETVDVTGTWTFTHSWSNEFGATQITAVLDLEQEGSEISGTHRDGTYKSSQCGALGGCFSDFRTVPGGPVRGSVEGTTVVLEFNASDSDEIDHYEGTLAGDTIQGDRWSAGRGTGGADEEGESQGGSSLPAPTNLQAAVVDTESGPAVDLSWEDNSDDEDGFVIGERCDAADFATIGETGPDATGTRVGGPFPGSECSYAVAAFREDADSVAYSPSSNVATVNLPSGLTVSGLSPSAGPVGTEVTIQGEGFSASGGSLTVSVSGQSATELIHEISDHSITLLMPNAGYAGEHEVSVSVGGITSDPVAWTQEGDADPGEPANDDPATAPAVSLPLQLVGSFSGGDIYDLYAFTLQSAATVEITLEWNNAKDLDVLVADPAVESAQCGGQGATFSKPEHISCSLPAGEYRLVVRDYDAAEVGDMSLVSYRIVALVQ